MREGAAMLPCVLCFGGTITDKAGTREEHEHHCPKHIISETCPICVRDELVSLRAENEKMKAMLGSRWEDVQTTLTTELADLRERLEKAETRAVTAEQKLAQENPAGLRTLLEHARADADFVKCEAIDLRAKLAALKRDAEVLAKALMGMRHHHNGQPCWCLLWPDEKPTCENTEHCCAARAALANYRASYPEVLSSTQPDVKYSIPNHVFDPINLCCPYDADSPIHIMTENQYADD